MDGVKLLIVFILSLAIEALAFDLPGAKNESQFNNVVKPTVQIEGRITNGNSAFAHQFPYLVGLSLYINAETTLWCGGCLIGHRWVLTAAHCTINAQSVTVYLGATYRTAAEVIYTVSNNNIIVHSGYNSEAFENDISLIRIPFVSFNSRVRTVKLPSVASSYSAYSGEYAIAAGWGRISDNEQFITDNLQWARLQIISNGVCRQHFKFLAPSSLCVATPGAVSTCKGDSGGPLVLESNELLVGLTSFGDATGCTNHYPTAFARVTSYLDWIYRNSGISY